MTPGRLVFPALRWRDATGFDHEEPAIAEALAFGAGGFLLFGGRRDAVAALTERLRREAGRPLLIAADLERGAGQQVSGLAELPPPLALASLADAAILRGAGLATGVQALSVGINWVLAPVADLDLEPANPIVQTRAFGADPQTVARAVADWIAGCEATGALACAKHFPGHGRTRHDSHDRLPVVTAPADQLRGTDLVPFEAAVSVGVSGIMTAHVAYPALDPSETPATFSPAILSELRQRLRFDGLIVSDALVMAGVRHGAGAGAAAVAAVKAGVDILLHPESPARVAEALAAAAARDRALAASIEAALRRYQRAAAAAAQAAPASSFDALPGSTLALGDWLLDQSAAALRSGFALRAPVELLVVDDDLGAPYPPSSPSSVVAATLRDRVPLGPGGDRLVLVFSEPRASKGRAGLGTEARRQLETARRGAALVVLFGHPRLAAELGSATPVLLAWHRQALMQQAAARWIAARIA